MSTHPVCSHCGRCKSRCEVLSLPDLDVGAIQAAYDSIASFEGDALVEAMQSLLEDDYATYHALRQCCFCGHCTAQCDRHLAAPAVMRAWRELFARTGIMDPNDSRLVMVDAEWSIFSAYRAIHGISYPEFPSLATAAEAGPGMVDTLLFPGCSLVSYAPELMRRVGTWLEEAGVRFALYDGCCGSPLMSAGLFERADALKEALVGQMRAAGIARVVTVCPGCAEEIGPFLSEGIDSVPLPELLADIVAERMASGHETGFDPLSLGSITFFDSCHDREDLRNAEALRALFARCLPESAQIEMEHAKADTLCCGAGGAVASYDPALTDARVWRVIEEARSTGADALVTMCPTCSYTIAQACLADPARAMASVHYLEALFGIRIDWETVFTQLGSMWTGEYGPWLNQTFFA